MAKKTIRTATLDITALLEIQQRGLHGLSTISEQYDNPKLRAAIDLAFNDFLEVYNQLDQYGRVDANFQAMLDELANSTDIEALLKELENSTDIAALLEELNAEADKLLEGLNDETLSSP